MGIPVKLKADGFVHMGEVFAKGEIFEAPHEAFASFICDQEKLATRVDASKLEPEQVGTMKRVMKGGYDTKVMTPDTGSNAPTKTKGGSKAKAKTTVKATSNAAENS